MNEETANQDAIPIASIPDATANRINPRAPFPPEIAKAIGKVMANVGYVQKKGKNTFHNYRYAASGDILAKLQPAMAEAELIIIPIEVEHRFDDAHGLLVAVYEFVLIHAGTGVQWEERLRRTAMARAKDSKGGWDDKALNKCNTTAEKYFLLGLFKIPTGDAADPDDDESPQAPPYEGQGEQNGGSMGRPDEHRDPRDEGRTETQPENPRANAENWVRVSIQEISEITAKADLFAWEDGNANTLKKLLKHPDLTRRINEAIRAQAAVLVNT